MSHVVVGSVRLMRDMLNMVTGAHIVTLPSQYFFRMPDYKNSRETVKQFLDDADKALRLMQQVTTMV